ncbi:fibronectin type III domain-containing protein [Deinococcus aquaticus]|uniref:fibronectin type III domain-containing protein n=1 Tax=Deinococcus aquaticus TaxID=328692 RepID=UPI003F482415
MRTPTTILIATGLLLLSACNNTTPTSPPTPAKPTPTPTALLTVESFGQGTVTSSAGAVDCTDQTCTTSVPQGKAVTLTAAPASGWRLDHWTGCDTATGATCTVTTTDARLVQPYFTTVTAPQANPDIILLTPETLDALQSDTDGVLIFAPDTAQIKPLTEGQILISDRGDGFARRVTDIISLDGGNTFVDTVEADLSELFRNGAVAARLNDLPAGDAASWQAAQGVTLQSIRPQADGSELASFTLDLTTPDGLSVTGEAKVAWAPEVAAEFGPKFGDLEAFKLDLHPSFESNLNVKLEGNRTYTPEPRKIASWRGAQKTLLIGGYPVFLRPTAEIWLTFEGQANATLELKGSYTLDANAGLTYVKGRGFRPLGSVTSKGTMKLDTKATVKANATTALPVEGKILFYDVGGPKLTIAPSITASGEYSATPTSNCLNFSTVLGAKASIGGEFTFGKQVYSTPDYTLFERDLATLWEWQSSDCDKSAPATPGALQFKEQTGGLTVSWPGSGTEAGLRYRIERDGQRLADTTRTTFNDTGVRPGQKYCYAVTAIDASGNPSPASSGCTTLAAPDRTPPATPTGLQATPSSTTAVKLTWNGTTDPNVAGYQILIGDQVIATVPNIGAAGSVTVPKLRPATRYCFTVRAYGRNGLSSAPSGESCATTLAPERTAWTMRIACAGSEYLITKGIDLDLDRQSNVNVLGNGNDYDGTALAYHLHGFFSPTNRTLSATIDWTFAGSSSVRQDVFVANLATGDSGDVAMAQTKMTGCDAIIRFSQGQAPLSLPKTSTSTSKFGSR